MGRVHVIRRHEGATYWTDGDDLQLIGAFDADFPPAVGDVLMLDEWTDDDGQVIPFGWCGRVLWRRWTIAGLPSIDFVVLVEKAGYAPPMQPREPGEGPDPAEARK